MVRITINLSKDGYAIKSGLATVGTILEVVKARKGLAGSKVSDL